MLNWLAGSAAAGSVLGAAAAVPFYAMAALQIVRVMERWKEATERIGAAVKYTNLAMGAINAALAETCNRVNGFPVPGSAYDSQVA